MNNRKETESLNLILSPIDLFSVLKYNLLTFFIIHPLINDKLPLSLLESKDKAVLQHKKISPHILFCIQIALSLSLLSILKGTSLIINKEQELMETVENKYITVAYKLYSIEDGERDFEEEASADHPFQFISGLGLTLEAFENQVKDLKPGDKFDFTIPADEAYGAYDDEHVIDLPKDIFVVEGKFDDERVIEGAVIPLMTAEGQRINGSVVEVKEDVVVMDMNHPLAGCDLNFTGEVVESRPATNEELAEVARMMSGGGCSCGCDDCGGGCGDHDHGCGEGCCH